MSQKERTPRKILVVEDEPIFGRILKRVLGAEGFEVDVMDNGLSAHEAALSKEYMICAYLTSDYPE